MTIFKGKLVTREINIEEINQGWISSSINFDTLKTAFNILLILEIILAQLTGVFLLPAQEAMQSSIHKSGMSIINSTIIQQFIGIIVITETAEFSTEVRNDQLKDQYLKLVNKSGARQSRFKGITPDVDMDPDSLMKYRMGMKYSLTGRFQTITIYSPQLVSNHYNLPLQDISLNFLKSISPFPEQFQKAIEFIKTIFEPRNPHGFNDFLEITPLMDQIGIQIKSNKIRVEEIFPDKSFTDEEKIRLERVNARIKKSKNRGPRRKKS